MNHSNITDHATIDSRGEVTLSTRDNELVTYVGDEVSIRSVPISSSIGASLMRCATMRNATIEAFYRENPDVVRVHLHYSGDAKSTVDKVFETTPGRYYFLCRSVQA